MIAAKIYKKPNMTYHKIGDYIKARQQWKQQHTAFRNGMIVVNGHEYSLSEFYQTNKAPNYEFPMDESNPGKPSYHTGCRTRKK